MIRKREGHLCENLVLGHTDAGSEAKFPQYLDEAGRWGEEVMREGEVSSPGQVRGSGTGSGTG